MISPPPALACFRRPGAVRRRCGTLWGLGVRTLFLLSAMRSPESQARNSVSMDESHPRGAQSRGEQSRTWWFRAAACASSDRADARTHATVIAGCVWLTGNLPCSCQRGRDGFDHQFRAIDVAGCRELAGREFAGCEFAQSDTDATAGMTVE